MHRVVDQPLMRALEVGHVAHQAGAAEQPRILARHGVGAQIVPKIGAVVAAQAEIGLEIAAVLLLQRPQHQAEALAVRRVHMLEEILDGNIERAGLQPELLLDLVGDGDLVAPRVPLEHMGARAVDGERLHLHQARRPEAQGRAAGAEGELRHGEAEQHQDQHQPGDEARDDEIAGELAEHDHGGAEQPDDEQHPAWNQRERAVLAAQREIRNQTGADAGDGDERGACQTRRYGRIDDGEDDQRELRARSSTRTDVLIQTCQSPMRRKV